MVQVYRQAIAPALPLTAIGTDGVEIAISDMALLTQINIIGDKPAERAGMHGMLVEQALDAGKGVLIVADNPRYFGIAQANGAHPEGCAYEVVTIGAGVKDTDIQKDDGPLIAQLIRKGGYSVIVNIQTLDTLSSPGFVYGLTDTLASMHSFENGMLFGFSSLSGTLPRRRMRSDGKAVAATNSFADRAYDMNVGVVNVASGAHEIPIEFDQKAKNTIAMLSVGEQAQVDLAARVGNRYRAALLANVGNSFGLGRSGRTYGTYFNPGDLDNANGVYIVTVKTLRSKIGDDLGIIKPNAITRKFMDELKAMRTKAGKKAAKNAKTAIAARAAERLEYERVKREMREQAKAGTDGKTAKKEAGRRVRDFTLIGDADQVRALQAHARSLQLVAAVAVVSTKDAPRQLRQHIAVTAADVAAIVDTDEVQGLARRLDAFRKRAGVRSSRGLVTGMHVIERHDPEGAKAFLATFCANTPEDSPAGVAIAALRDGGLTPHQTADVLMQAYIAHRDGLPFDGRSRNTHFTPLAANSDGAIAKAA